MRRAGIVLVGWGLWLGLWTAVQAAFRSVPGPLGVHWIEAVLLGTAAGACLLCGLVLWRLDARDGAHERPRALTSDSFATGTLIGAGVTALGVGGLVREGLARRRRRGGAETA